MSSAVWLKPIAYKLNSTFVRFEAVFDNSPLYAKQLHWLR